MEWIEHLRKRRAELLEQEKACWANLNATCGARAEIERLLAEAAPGGAPAAGPEGPHDDER